MKIYLALILSCVSAIAADTSDIRVVTTTDTHTQPGILITIDEFTRAGQTNLLTKTQTPTRDGLVSRDLESLRVLQGWITDARFAQLLPSLQKAEARLRGF